MRKSPSQPRSRRTVSILLDAASQILETRGEETLTTTAIAERAGFSIGTLYQYFPDRDALLMALAQRERQRIAVSMAAFFDKLDAGTSPDAMRVVVRELIASFTRRRGARRQYALLALHMASRDDGRSNFDDFSEILMSTWRRLGPRREAALDRAHAYVLTRAVQGVLRSAILERNSPLKEKSFEDALLLLITAFMDARAGDSPRPSREGSGGTPSPARRRRAS